MPWAYLPLEMSRKEHIFRYASCLEGSFDLMDDEGGSIRRDKGIINRNREQIEKVRHHILENPTLEDDGVDIDADEMKERIRELSSKNRLVIVDPFGHINFDEGGREFSEQADFVKFLSAQARKTSCSILLVAHTIKRTEAYLTMADVEGSKRITTAADTVVMIKYVDNVMYNVIKQDGDREELEANRVFYIAKARNCGASRLAFRFGDDGPVFKELGVITKKL